MASTQTIGRTTAWIVSLVVLLVIGSIGVYNGVTEWRQGTTAWQHSVNIGVLLYGVLGLVSAYGLLRRQRWALRTVIVWAVAVTYVPGVAILAYADKDAMLGSAIAASVASGLIALGIIWTTSVMTRADQSAVPGL